jgi:hypothetical protein
MQTRTLTEGPVPTWRDHILLIAVVFTWTVLGLIFGTLILGLGAMAAVGLAARLWWVRRRLRHTASVRGARVLDGRYVVLDERRPDPGGWRA